MTPYPFTALPNDWIEVAGSDLYMVTERTVFKTIADVIALIKEKQTKK